MLFRTHLEKRGYTTRFLNQVFSYDPDKSTVLNKHDKQSHSKPPVLPFVTCFNAASSLLPFLRIITPDQDILNFDTSINKVFTYMKPVICYTVQSNLLSHLKYSPLPVPNTSTILNITQDEQTYENNRHTSNELIHINHTHVHPSNNDSTIDNYFTFDTLINTIDELTFTYDPIAHDPLPSHPPPPLHSPPLIPSPPPPLPHSTGIYTNSELDLLLMDDDETFEYN